MPIVSGPPVGAPVGDGPQLVASPEPGAAPPRVRLDLDTGDPAQNGLVQVSVLTPDGRTKPVRGGIRVTGGVGFGYHYEPPFGQPVMYLTTDEAGLTSTRVVLDSDVALLTHPFRPSLSVVVDDASRSRPHFHGDSFAERTADSTAAFLEPLGRRDDPIVISSGTLSTPSSSFLVRTATLAQRDALWRLLGDDLPLLMNVPASYGLGSIHEWVQPTAVREARLPSTPANHPVRLFTITYRVVGAPLGDFRAVWTGADLLADFDTGADVLAAYETGADLETDTRRTA